MAANQTRFHLLLGETDWATSSLPGDGEIFSPTSPVEWARHEVTLRSELFRFRPAPRDDPPAHTERRGAAADAYSNWYWIAQGRAEIRIQSSGEQVPAHFWSAADASTPPPAPDAIFQPVAPPAPPPARVFSGL